MKSKAVPFGEEEEAAGKWYPADMSDLHVGHVLHDLCKINSYYKHRLSSACRTLLSTTSFLLGYTSVSLQFLSVREEK